MATIRICDLCKEEVPEFHRQGIDNLRTEEIQELCLPCNRIAHDCRSRAEDQARGYKDKFYLKELAKAISAIAKDPEFKAEAAKRVDSKGPTLKGVYGGGGR